MSCAADWQPGASPRRVAPITLRADERRLARSHTQRAALLRLRLIEALAAPQLPAHLAQELTAAIQGVIDLARERT